MLNMATPRSRSKLRISATFRNPERFVIRRERLTGGRLSKINGPIIVESFPPARERRAGHRKCNFFGERRHVIRHSRLTFPPASYIPTRGGEGEVGGG